MDVLHAHCAGQLRLLHYTGPEIPGDLKEDADKTVTSKPEVIAWLKKSLEDGEDGAPGRKTQGPEPQSKIHDRDATVDGMYLRIIVHANEHMGQLIAYARMSGVKPPWSKE